LRSSILGFESIRLRRGERAVRGYRCVQFGDSPSSPSCHCVALSPQKHESLSQLGITAPPLPTSLYFPCYERYFLLREFPATELLPSTPHPSTHLPIPVTLLPKTHPSPRCSTPTGRSVFPTLISAVLCFKKARFG
jgi:hypothetical protein